VKSTNDSQDESRLPRHIAVIMDGNGRWAQHRRRPRGFGHREGVKAVRELVRGCGERGIEVLTLFAFSGENWARPQAEVRGLMELLTRALRKESAELHEKNVRLRFIGDLSRFSDELRLLMQRTMERSSGNSGMTVNVAVNYSGRWDLSHAAAEIAREVAAGRLSPGAVDEACLHRYTALSDLPPPDLLIRTGGELRISNFLLWQMAYTEMVFSDVLWPDFNDQVLEEALQAFASRERRFGRTSEQVRDAAHASSV
jgi:undecaprenyl diphosphate synthase